MAADAQYSRTPATAEGHDFRARRQARNGSGKPSPGLIGWLSTVDHKEIGMRYMVTAFVFLLLGGIEALIMRLQLARPEQTC